MPTKEGSNSGRERLPEIRQRDLITEHGLDSLLRILETTMGPEVVDDPARRAAIVAEADASRQFALATQIATPETLAQDRQGEYDHTRTVPFTLDMTGMEHPEQPPVMPAGLMGQAPTIGE